MKCEKVTTPEGTVFLCGPRRPARRPAATPDRQPTLEDAMATPNEEPGKCRSCPATIEWARTYKSDSPIPLDVGPLQPGQGNLLMLPDTRKVVHLSKPEAAWLEGLGIELRRSHFVSCPNRDRHRKPRG